MSGEDMGMINHPFIFPLSFKNVFIFNISQFLSFFQFVAEKFPAHCKKSSFYY